MDDLSEADFQKEEQPASPAPPPSQQHTDPASPTVAVTPEPVARGDQATPGDIEYQVRDCAANVCWNRGSEEFLSTTYSSGYLISPIGDQLIINLNTPVNNDIFTVV